MTKPFHLSWFLSQGYGPKGWRGKWPGSDMNRWMMPDLFVDLARGMERACFDYMIIEDSSMLPYQYKGTHDTYLKYAASILIQGQSFTNRFAKSYAANLLMDNRVLGGLTQRAWPTRLLVRSTDNLR